MAHRFLSGLLLRAAPLLLVLRLLHLASADREIPDSVFGPTSGTGAGTVSALGDANNINFRLNADYTYIPNYGDTLCDQYVSYDNSTGEVIFDPAGSKYGGVPNVNSSCCGKTNAAGRQACGPEFWVFSETSSSGGNSFYKCQSTNSQLSSSANNNQQTPINIQTVSTYQNKPLSLPDISSVPDTHPPTDPAGSGRTPTGFSFGSIFDKWPLFDYTQCTGTFSLQSGVWQVDYEPASTTSCNEVVKIGTKWFRLAQFHLHNAEHTINGMYYPAELHCVHFEWDPVTKTQNTSKPLVLGFFLSVGWGPNAYVQKLINGFGDSTAATTTPFNPYFLIKQIKDGGYWHYIGSLTTPPCQLSTTSYVRWFLFKKPLLVSASQLQYFSSYFFKKGISYNGQTARPIQKVLPATVVYNFGPPIF